MWTLSAMTQAVILNPEKDGPQLRYRQGAEYILPVYSVVLYSVPFCTYFSVQPLQ